MDTAAVPAATGVNSLHGLYLDMGTASGEPRRLVPLTLIKCLMEPVDRDAGERSAAAALLDHPPLQLDPLGEGACPDLMRIGEGRRMAGSQRPRRRMT